MAVSAAKKLITYHHLLVVDDGEIRINELFLSEKELHKHFVDGLRDGSIDLGTEQEEIEATIIEAEQEAAAADYEEGTGAPAQGDPENSIDALRDMLQGHGVDVFIDRLHAPVPKERL